MGGLSFLNTGLLFFAAATILPLLIWLLAKKKPKRIVFSTLRFIKASQEQEKKRTRLKNIILLIIRMLIILLVALAVARPLFQSKHLKPARQHPPTALAILLDTSFSMDYVHEARSNLDRARAAIQKINALCTPQDRLILVTSDESWNRLHAQIYAGKIPTDLLEKIAVTYSPLALDSMLQLAESKLSDTQLANRELYLLTDGQQQDYPQPREQTLYVIDVSESKEFENLSCQGARVLPQLVEKSRRQNLEFQLSNHGRQDRTDILVKVVLGGAKVAEKFVDLPALQSVNQTISIDLQKDGWQSGYVEVMDDRLLPDNRSYFSFPFTANPRIAVISARQSLPEYLQTMLQVYAGPQAQISILDPRRISLATQSEYQTFVIYAPGAFSPKLREFVATLQKSGRGALFCLDPALTSEYKSWLGSTFGLTVSTWQTQAKSISYINKHHFITSLMADKNLRNKAITDYWKLSGSGASTLLGSGAEPLAVAKDNLVLWSFDPGSLGSSFFLDAAFAVFAYRSLEFVSTAVAAGENHQLGEVLSAQSIILPDGKLLQLTKRSYKLSEPGIYTLQQNDRASTVIAVDYPRQESVWERMDYSGLTNTKLLDGKWQNSLFHTRLGHDLWKWLLSVALALFFLEIILVKAEELRPASAQTSSSTGSK